jgi:hypothetical protein
LAPNSSNRPQSKCARAALLERRYGLDSEEKCALRACLDHLSEAIPVRDAVSMAERLEAVARKTSSESGSLSFMADPVHGSFYLSNDMFYVEVRHDCQKIVIKGSEIESRQGLMLTMHLPSMYLCNVYHKRLKKSFFWYTYISVLKTFLVLSKK